ncbi:MAG TPA: efflux RND transporter periplasmic adaptor subunit [Candidatus Polarisedimenticolaceae bacterium]|nr:efflux RND transporter periplasmic adaptor subunit [Candidatus Polarisedimenticolaceae bacterium]
MISNTATSAMDRPAEAKRRPKWLLAAAIGVPVIALAALSPSITRWARSDRAVDAATVRYGTVTRGDLLRDLSLQARVVASLSPMLFSPGPGIVSLRTRAGAPVKKGDVLAVVDSPELTAALDQARSLLSTSQAELGRQRIAARQAQLRAVQQHDLLKLRLEAAKRQLARAEKTHDEGLSSQADYETAQDAVRIAEIEFEQAQRERDFTGEGEGFEVATREQQVRRQESVVAELTRRVDDLTIKAPFDGMVASVAVEDRDAVVMNQPVVAVVNLGTLELEIRVPEEYGSEATIGTPATIVFLGREHPGRVTSISPQVVQGELTARVEFEGKPPEGLRQSQTLTTRLTFESKKNVLKVPRGGFLEAEGGRAAYVVDGKIAVRRPIVVGATSTGEVEVVSGLREGERIVASDTASFERAQTVLLR